MRAVRLLREFFRWRLFLQQRRLLEPLVNGCVDVGRERTAYLAEQVVDTDDLAGVLHREDEVLEGRRQSQQVAEAVDSVLEVDVERAHLRRQRVPALLGIPARDAVEQERLEVGRVHGRPRDEACRVEVEALNGRGSAGAPQDRKLDAALSRRPSD